MPSTKQPALPAGDAEPPEDGAALADLFDYWLRIRIEYPDRQRESFPALVRFLRAAPGTNEITYSRLDPGELDTVIAEQIAFFCPRKQPLVWVVCDHDRPANLRERLIAHGFRADEDPSAVMALDLHQAPRQLLEAQNDRVRRLEHSRELTEVVQILEQAVGGNYDWLPIRLGAHLHVPGYLSVYTARAGARPVSCGWVYFPPNNLFAELYGGATVPEHRRRGLYTAILAARVQEAVRRGVRYLATGASPMSRPILAEDGFRLLTSMHSMRWEGRMG